MSRWNVLLIPALFAGVLTVAAQETRGTIQGRVLDPSGAALPRAFVLVENVDMKTATRLTSNDTGYYEATLLLPDN